VTLEKGLSPREVADKFYESIVARDIDRFKVTLKKTDREQMERVRGTSPEFWWESGRRYVENYSVTWEFHAIREEGEDTVVLWFKRLNADGTQRGSVVPIHLTRDKDDGGEWRVEVATL
jgi:hypothetical protein